MMETKFEELETIEQDIRLEVMRAKHIMENILQDGIATRLDMM